MYKNLVDICEKPGLYEFYTAEKMWNDPHISKVMLEYHLDQNCELASRKPEFIRRAARFMVERFDLGRGGQVADFGCGPGLYATELARLGAEVTGIDFSENSIRYARKCAQEQGLAVEYVQADYLELELDRKFDLISLIYCDLCALSPEQRRLLLEKFRKLLKPGGKVFLDVFSMTAYGERSETTVFEENLMDGFWSDKSYYGFMNTFEYPEDQVYLDKYTIVQADSTWRVYNWLKYYDVKSLTREVELAGFKVEEVFAGVAGGKYDPDEPQFAVCLGCA